MRDGTPRNSAQFGALRRNSLTAHPSPLQPRLSVFEDGNRSGCVWVLNGTLTRDLSLTWPNGAQTTYTNFGASAADPPPTRLSPPTAAATGTTTSYSNTTLTTNGTCVAGTPLGVGAWFYDHKASTDLLPWLPDLPAALNASSATLRVTLRADDWCWGQCWLHGYWAAVLVCAVALLLLCCLCCSLGRCCLRATKRGQPLSPLRRRHRATRPNFEGGGDSLLGGSRTREADPRDDPAARVN